jgi:hypothetical protein
MDFPPYTTGTVSIADGETTLVFTGSLLGDMVARRGDRIYVDNEQPGVEIFERTDTTHCEIAVPWSGGTKVNVPFTIIADFPARVAGVEAAEDVTTLVALQNVRGFMIYVPPEREEPDQSWGDEAQTAYQPATGKKWTKDGGLWVYDGQTDAIFSRYDLATFDTDRPASGELILKIYPVGVTFRAGMIDSQGGAEVAATASSVFSLTKNGTQFATLTFGAASATGVIACASDTTFTTGDVLRVIAPSPRDATLSGVAATFIGYR